MSITVNTGDVLSARLEFRNEDGTVAFNVLHYQVAGIDPVPPNPPYPPGSVFMTEFGPAFANAVFDNLAPGWTPFASNEVTFTGVSVQNLWPASRSVQFHYTAPVPQPGDVDDQALPLQDTPTIIKQTLFGERWGLGRMYVVGIPEVGQQFGSLTPAYATLVNAFAGNVKSPVEVSIGVYVFTLIPILYADIGPDDPPRITIVTNMFLSNPVIKTQRRRRPGKGI